MQNEVIERTLKIELQKINTYYKKCLEALQHPL